jgi:hypothetical protein
MPECAAGKTQTQIATQISINRDTLEKLSVHGNEQLHRIETRRVGRRSGGYFAFFFLRVSPRNASISITADRIFARDSRGCGRICSSR